MKAPIYLDYNASTPLDPRVIEVMRPHLEGHFGNPSSRHVYGQHNAAAIAEARRQVAALLGCSPPEILFTSGGTESNNTVLKGVAELRAKDGGQILISEVEHPAIEVPCQVLESRGFRVTRLAVDGHGRVDLKQVQQALSPETILVSIMHANNEVGTLQPIAEIAALMKAHAPQAWLHSDASQSVGKVPVRVAEMGVDFLTVAGHKLYAPKGVGALYIREGLSLPPLLHGAGHESGRRAGTENVLEIAGLGEAARIAHQELQHESQRIEAQRELLWQLLSQVPHIQQHGHPLHRLPNTLHVGIRDIAAPELLDALQQQVAASAGSACHADELQISGVLQAMGIEPAFARGSLRLSLGRFTTDEEIREAGAHLVKAIATLRKNSTPS